MSTDIVSIIPTDPFWVPVAEAAAAARAILARVYPGARKVAMDWHEGPVFVDQGENFETVRCPGCQINLPIDWWQDRMNEAYATNFHVLTVCLTCCGHKATLNDLVYSWPAGFARFVLFAASPQRAGSGDRFLIDARPLDSGELAVIANALDHPVKQVVARY
jgi:hypothetical protein